MSEAYEPSSAPKRSASGWVFLILLLVVVGGGLATMQWLGSRKSDAPTSRAAKPVIKRAPGVKVSAQLDAHGPARVVFEEHLADFVIALDRWNGAVAEIAEGMAEARGALIRSAREAGIHSDAVQALEVVLDSAIRAAVAPPQDSKLRDAAKEVFTNVQSLNEALGTAGLGFFVDADISRRDSKNTVLLFAFEIDRVVLYRSEGRDVRTLRVRRLDSLSKRYTMLGFTSPQRLDAIVLDHLVDSHLMELLPLLDPECRVDPFELPLKDTYTTWYTEARKRAAKVVSEELAEADEGVSELGLLVGQRYELVQEWNRLLKSRGVTLRTPETLEFPFRYRTRMKGLATNAAMNKLDAIQKKLTGARMRQIFADAQEHMAQSVERHEVQHRLDLAGLYTLPMPEELAAYVGDLPDGYQGEGGTKSSALAELSAYLSELARDPKTPRINLTMLARYLLNTKAQGMGESYAALAVFEGLAAELRIDHEPLVVRRNINREAAAGLYMAFTELDPDTLQDAATMLWHRYFGRDLPVLELVSR